MLNKLIIAVFLILPLAGYGQIVDLKIQNIKIEHSYSSDFTRINFFIKRPSGGKINLDKFIFTLEKNGKKIFDPGLFYPDMKKRSIIWASSNSSSKEASKKEGVEVKVISLLLAKSLINGALSEYRISVLDDENNQKIYFFVEEGKHE